MIVSKYSFLKTLNFVFQHNNISKTNQISFSILQHQFVTSRSEYDCKKKNIKVIKSITFLPVLGVFLLFNITESGRFSEDETSLIRIYEGQYFVGNFWSLDTDGTWTRSRRPYFRRPYRNFGIKSIRMYGPDHCRWQICPIRTRRNFHLPRWKKCRLAEASKEINLASLRRWGWKYCIIGNVIRLPPNQLNSCWKQRKITK